MDGADRGTKRIFLTISRLTVHFLDIFCSNNTSAYIKACYAFWKIEKTKVTHLIPECTKIPAMRVRLCSIFSSLTIQLLKEVMEIMVAVSDEDEGIVESGPF